MPPRKKPTPPPRKPSGRSRKADQSTGQRIDRIFFRIAVIIILVAAVWFIARATMKKETPRPETPAHQTSTGTELSPPNTPSAMSASTPEPSSSPIAATETVPRQKPVLTPVEKKYTVQLYFIRPRGKGYQLEAVTRTLVGAEHPLESTLRLLLRLSAREVGGGLDTTWQSGIRLKSVRLIDGQAILDFNSALGMGPGMMVEARLKQLIWTATQFSNVTSVVITIDGKRVSSLSGDGVDISRPLNRSWKWH